MNESNLEIVLAFCLLCALFLMELQKYYDSAENPIYSSTYKLHASTTFHRLRAYTIHSSLVFSFTVIIVGFSSVNFGWMEASRFKKFQRGNVNRSALIELRSKRETAVLVANASERMPG